MKKTPVTWVLVSDGGKARIHSIRRHPPEFSQVAELDSPTRKSTDRDLVSDASGRSRNARGPGTHVREPRISAHDQGEIRFVADLMERLARASRAGSFDSLVLAADPRTLGKMRSKMDAGTRGKLLLELNLDLTGLDNGKLEKRLRKALNWPLA